MDLEVLELSTELLYKTVHFKTDLDIRGLKVFY